MEQEQHPVRIREATLADATRLSELAATTFREAFEGENAPDDIARYLAETFTPEMQAAEIADPAGCVLLAEHRTTSSDPELIGYAHLLAGPAPAAVHGAAPMELKRLYVARAWHGRGVAQTLMESVLEVAGEREARTIWLGVWERNPRAAAFYAKYHFTRVGEHEFVLGTDVQRDWLMARPVGLANSVDTRR